ncbi:MAG: nucleotide exchange factor GrpE [Pelagibacteraceae bacterium]|jgi:molecular chaperone GrpE|nr:nucleotide exchange factor GrpE [Pelagibacteraceae bacterium]|tara:strand:- start:5447 stop:6085 length:639 start_codon:yes stop_codon:yes gene_type:complete
MKVEEKNESDLKQDQSKNPQSEKDADVVIEKDKIQDEKNKEESSGKKVKELEEKVLRTLAEMENQRRRFEKEREEAFEFGGFAFAKESLALIDNLERARTTFANNKKFKENKDFSKILESFEILEKDLISIFKRNNIKQIICKNNKFDPNFHQAMLEIDDTSKESGTVVQEIQKGYTMKDRLLRPSLVGVTRFKNEDVKKDQENKDNHDSKK